MKNNVNKYYEDVLTQYDELPEEATDALNWWIDTYISPAKTCTDWLNSYALKQVFEWTVNGYVSNDQFKAAMLEKGYTPIDLFELNWHFKIGRVKYDKAKSKEAYALARKTF